MAKVKQHTVGTVRYFTYYLIFPGDKDYWVDQTPFVHDLEFQLQQTAFRKEPAKMRDLLQKGETRWKDHNGVEHLVKIEEVQRARKWGVKRH